MTYAERIERVKEAICCPSGCARKQTPCARHLYDAEARAADRAVLEAIREPTEEMFAAATREEATEAVDGLIQIAQLHGFELPAQFIDPGKTPLARWYRAMHAAIPRGEEQ